MNHLLLPHELRIEAQNWNINYFEVEGLKVAHEKFTWNGYKIPCIGRYGVHVGKTLV